MLELIIALGIGALVTATVLLSAQGAERSQRDTRRRADLNKLSTALEQWADNNSGKYPVYGGEWSGTAGRFVSEGYWKGDEIKDPRSGGGLYSYQGSSVASSCPLSPNTDARIGYENPTPRQFILTMCLEGGTYTLKSSQ